MREITRTQWVWAEWQYGHYAYQAIPQQGSAHVALADFRGLRRLAGLRPSQLARRLEVHRTTVMRMEHPRQRDLGIIAMERYANACGFLMKIKFEPVTEERKEIR